MIGGHIYLHLPTNRKCPIFAGDYLGLGCPNSKNCARTWGQDGIKPIETNNLDKLYKQVKSKGVTMTALLAKAVAITLAKHPTVNASYNDAGRSEERRVGKEC